MRLLLLILTFISTSAFYQGAERYTIVLDVHLGKDVFREFAFQLVGQEVLIDTAFNIHNFDSDIRLDASNYPSITELSQMPTSEIKQIQDAIDAVEWCDYVNPIIIYTSNNTRFEWKRITNCYPESAKFVDELDIDLSAILDMLYNMR